MASSNNNTKKLAQQVAGRRVIVGRLKWRKEIAGVVVVFLACWSLFLFYAHFSLTRHVPDAAVDNQQQQPLPFSVQRRHIAEESAHDLNNANAALTMISDNKKANDNTNKNDEINNPWYGWQPEIHSNMSCSWRKCFEKDHGCSTCRDLVVEIGEPPPPPPLDWVPDVTMLRRMLLDGHDANGNKWPPLLDKELCEPMGVFGGRNDDNQHLLAAVPIHAMPFSKAAATTDSKNSNPQQQVQVEGPKIMCLVYTMETAHANSIRAIRETWASGCDGFLAFSTRSDPRIPAISLPHDGPEDYNNMWQKVRSIWRFVGTHYAGDFDFFLMGGDDLFVLPQNLRNYLRSFSPDDDHFLGRRFKGGGKDNYFNSGGAGYTLSRSALKKFVSIGLDHPQCHPNGRTSMEDVMIAECLARVLQIHFEDTRDAQGRERFHPFSPGSHFSWKPPAPGKNADWYEQYNKEWGLKLGKDCCAPDSVSFHYMKKPAMVRHLHSLLYNCNNNNDH
jgi:glycoprotein-N-acetylgalactosamine 3-beta-galactosyltransferase